MYGAIFILLLLLGLLIRARRTKAKLSRKQLADIDFPESERKLLVRHVLYYNSLSTEEKARFEKEVQYFLATTIITGIKTEVTEEDRMLVAASAVIPTFGFPGWDYYMLDEVLLYSSNFNATFETHPEAAGRSVLGMVGSGPLSGKVALSQPALRHGFQATNDSLNVGIHEFTHLIDQADGFIDGVPEYLLDKTYILPWLELVQQKMEEIVAGNSKIRAYGASNKQEFFAVASEYFFEKPRQLQTDHPALYKLLKQVFRQDTMSLLKKSFTKSKTGRNDQCPCGSGLKFKHCCGKG